MKIEHSTANLLGGMVFGALVALGITFGYRWRVHSPTPAQPIEDRLQHQLAQDEWLRRRDLEFDKCAALHGTPTLGFGMRVVCLDPHAVKFLGEEHPPD